MSRLRDVEYELKNIVLAVGRIRRYIKNLIKYDQHGVYAQLEREAIVAALDAIKGWADDIRKEVLSG